MTSSGARRSWRAGEIALPILDLIEDQISVVDAGYRYRFCNRAFCERHGATIDRLIEQPLSVLLGSDALQQFRKGYEKSLAGEVVRWSSWVSIQLGETTFLDCCFAPCRNHDGSVLGSVCIARDLTRQLNGEEALKQSEQRFRDFAEIASDWLWEMDADLRFSWFSSDVEEKTGVPAEWHYGKTREEIASPDVDRKMLAEHLRVLNARKPYRNFRLMRRGPDGDRWVKSNGKPIFDDAGIFIGYRGTGTDITAQVEAEKAEVRQRELEVALDRERELNGLQRQFVSMVSHEFRTPLAIIDGNAQRIERRLKTLPCDRIAGALTTIRRSVCRLIALMESVLDAAQLEEGRIKFEPSDVSISSLLKDLVESHAELYPDREFTLNFDALPSVMQLDDRLIRQVLSNLMSNALKYSPDGSTVRLSAWIDKAEAVCIAVRDEGVGIPQEELDQLFDRFFRASTSTGIAGSGIGLHLVRHFVDLHGGSVGVESEEGIGTTFTVRLPSKAGSR